MNNTNNKANYINKSPFRACFETKLQSEILEDNWILYNTNAGLFKAGIWGLEAIYRNMKGDCLAICMHNTNGGNNPILAEAMVILKACEVAIDCCFKDVGIQSDNQTLVKTINNDEITRTN